MRWGWILCLFQAPAPTEIDLLCPPDALLRFTRARVVAIEARFRVLGPGEVGRLLVRGPQVMDGYLDQPQATDEVLIDGWLATGDIASCDHDGFFPIVDRLKDLVITSGFNVYPGEVEAVRISRDTELVQ